MWGVRRATNGSKSQDSPLCCGCKFKKGPGEGTRLGLQEREGMCEETGLQEPKFKSNDC